MDEATLEAVNRACWMAAEWATAGSSSSCDGSVLGSDEVGEEESWCMREGGEDVGEGEGRG